MRRRRPFIPPRRRIFLGCEGASEQGYGTLLQRLIEERRQDIHLETVLLQPGAGDPLSLVLRAQRHMADDRGRRGVAYEIRALLLDADRRGQSPERDAELQRIAVAVGLRLIWQVPSHEALLLHHLEGCEGMRPATSLQAEAELRRRWPNYEKGMTAMQLQRRIGWPDVERACRVERDLALFIAALERP